MSDRKVIQDVLPLTPMQQGMLFHYLKKPESDIYFEQLSLELSGNLEKEVFNKAWNAVINVNEMLRTTFHWEKLGNPVQIILKEYSFQPIYYDLSEDTPQNVKKQLNAIKFRDKKMKFNLRKVPFRITVCKIRENHWEMIISNHHILFDGWSTGIILAEFFNAYNTFSQSREWIKPVKAGFKEFVKRYQRYQPPLTNSVEQENFWKNYLEGIEFSINKNIIRRNTRNLENGNANFTFTFNTEEKAALENVCKNHKITSASLIYSAWGILLQKYDNTNDVLFGTTMSGRSGEIPGIEKIVGLFINTIPLRIHINANDLALDLITHIREDLQTRQKYEHSSLADIKKSCRLTANEELFNSIVIIENYPLDRQLMMENGSLKVESYSMQENSYYDLTLQVKLFSTIEVTFNYQDSMDEETAAKLPSHFKSVVLGIIKNPGQKISEIDFLTEREKKQLLYDFNNTSADYPADKTVHKLFVEQVEQFPDSIAVVSYCQHISYSQLNDQSDQLAGLLIEKGVLPDNIVAIMIERSIEMIIGILGILKSGAAYLPIDPNYPQERIDYMLKDSKTKILLANKSEIRKSKSETNPNDQNTNDQNKNFGFPFVLNFENLNLEFVSNFDICASDFNSSNLAYIIYTSGSTGRSKGVMIEHRSAVNLLYTIQNQYFFRKADTYLLKTSYTFDVSVTELFGWYMGGGKLAVLEKDGHKDPRAIMDAIERDRISHINFVPSMFSAFIKYLTVENKRRMSSLKYIFLAGEALLPDMVEKFRRLDTGIVLENIYGPTESTVYSSSYSLSEWDGTGSIPIGRPLQNITLYILDKYNYLQPIGVPGELFITGSGVARGYLNNPELTAEKFLKYRSYGSYKTYIFYKTGDLARWLNNGTIEFLGRIDQQVKIRGYRIEPQEIETQLLAHANIKETVVISRIDNTGDSHLCAYYVAKKEEEIMPLASLREFLTDRLPDYMIPSSFVKLYHLPLTPNGKIDLKALPFSSIAELKSGQEYIAPSDSIEKKLAEIWTEILFGKDSLPLISINDNFFDLGGHSLKAMLLSARIQKEFGINFPLSQLFKLPRLKALAEFIRHAGAPASQGKYQEIVQEEKKEYYPLSSAQKRLFFLDRFEQIGVSYNMPFVLKIMGKLDKKRFENAFYQLIHRHEILRTSFELSGTQPVQRIHPAGSIVFEISEIDKRADDFDTKKIETHIDSFVRRFDLSLPPLLRVELVHLDEEEYMLLFDMHHIISDGMSTGILITEFSRLYTGQELIPLEIQYKDYSVWQQKQSGSSTILKQEEFWFNHFFDGIPRLDLPADFPRPASFTFEGDRLAFGLDNRKSGGLKEICLHSEVTLFISLMTVFNILLYKYTGEEDMVVGTVTAGRSHQVLQENIGMFVNTLALRNCPGGKKTYLEFLHEVKAAVIQAFENQDLQFETLVDKLEVEREASRNPLFDICFVTQNFELKEVKLPDLTFLPYEYTAKISQFDLTLEAWQQEESDDIVFYLEYYTRLFKRETMEVFSQHFLNIIAQICRMPGILISEIELISEEEKHSLVIEFNNTANIAGFYPADKTISELFAEQVKISPHVVAGVFNNQYLTYGELKHHVEELAGYLVEEKGLCPDDRIGLMMEKCSDGMDGVISIMGILKAGGAYVPIAPFSPEERIKEIIKDAGIGVLISSPTYLRTLDRLLGECKELHTILFLDNRNIRDIDEVYQSGIEENELQHMKNLWNYIGETAEDEITGGGWLSSYTGAPISKLEMEEYAANVQQKLAPLLNEKTRVLEIGCASGITMFRLAPQVEFYYGTDISSVIIGKNKHRVEREGHKNIELATLAAHEIDQIKEKDFDIVIINSVIQDFFGPHYLRMVILKALALMKETSYFFFGDIMDFDLKDQLIREMKEFKRNHAEQWYKTKIDFSGELFISREFFRNLCKDIPALREPIFSSKIHTIENELTRFRYDVLVKVDKPPAGQNLLKKPHKGRLLNKSKLAYVMYTSGSTGSPKGVLIEQQSIVNLVYWFYRTFNIGPGIHLLQLTDYWFDPSVKDIFGTLLFGATLYIGSGELNIARETFKAYVDRYQVHIVDFVPSALGLLLDSSEKLKSLNVVISGGEPLDEALKDKLVGLGYRLYNNYGPTEATVDALSWECSGDGVYLGRPIANTHCYVLDKDEQLAGLGVKGELCIAGTGVSRGYLNDPELTSEKFQFNKSYTSYRPYISFYKTGDLVRRFPGGELAFIGRKDHQVKIRGYRIEPGEIEKQIRELNEFDDIEEVVVVAKEFVPGETYLCAYIVSGKVIDVSGLKNNLSRKLPDYMIPHYFIQLKKIPRRATGKVNTKALPDPVQGVSGKGPDYTAPRDELEERLTFVWADVLGIEPEQIGIDGNFFELGGHSLKAAILTTKIHRELNINIPLAEIFRLPSIRSLAEYIKQKIKIFATLPKQWKKL